MGQSGIRFICVNLGHHIVNQSEQTHLNYFYNDGLPI